MCFAHRWATWWCACCVHAVLDARLLTSLVSGSPDGTRFTGVLRSERLARRIAHSRGWPPSGGLGPSPPQERPRNHKKGGKRGSGDQRTDSPGVRIFSGFSHATARAMRARYPVAGRALPAVTRLPYGTLRGISHPPQWHNRRAIERRVPRKWC